MFPRIQALCVLGKYSAFGYITSLCLGGAQSHYRVQACLKYECLLLDISFAGNIDVYCQVCTEIIFNVLFDIMNLKWYQCNV